MGFQTDLLTGIGEYLHAQKVGRWLTGGTFAPTDVALVIDRLPTAPDRAVALSLYDVEDGAGTDSVVGLQAWIRGARNNLPSAKDITDALFDALHGLERATLGGTPIVRIWRQSGANLGPDSNGREEISQNYYLQLTRSGTHRTD